MDCLSKSIWPSGKVRVSEQPVTRKHPVTAVVHTPAMRRLRPEPYLRKHMVTNEEIKSIRALKDRKSRHAAGRFVVEGVKGVMELCASACDVVRIYAEPDVKPFVEAGLLPVWTVVSAGQMKRMSAQSTPPGILAVASIPRVSPDYFRWEGGTLNAWSPLPVIVVTDGIQDPGNLGTLIRSADWFGARGVWISETSVDAWNPKTIQASMGSAFRLPVHQAPLSEAESCNPELPWVVLDARGTPLPQHRWRPCYLLVGSESHGISAAWLGGGHTVCSIPGAGRAESLNAGVAGSIALSWAHAASPFPEST